MKKSLAAIIFAIVASVAISSCSSYSCPTYTKTTPPKAVKNTLL